MTDRAPLEHTYSLQAPPDTNSGEGGPREPRRLLPEPPSPTREVRIVLHDASAVKSQEPLADVPLEALDIRADADYKDDLPAIDLGLWYRHACRPYLVKFATGQPSYEVKQITQDAEELRNRIKEDLLRTGRALFTLEFDERKRIKVQEKRRMAKIGLRRRLFYIIFKKRVRQHITQGQNSLDDTGSVRSDDSGSSWDSAKSNLSQTSESAMNDTEQSCAQLLRDIEDARQFHMRFRKTVMRSQEMNDLQNALQKLEDSLKVHQDNAREIGCSDIGLALNKCHQKFEAEIIEKLEKSLNNRTSRGMFRKLRDQGVFIAMTKRISDTEREIDEIMAQGQTVFDEFYDKSLLLMDAIVHSVAQETNYKVSDVVENNMLVKRKFTKENTQTEDQYS